VTRKKYGEEEEGDETKGKRFENPLAFEEGDFQFRLKPDLVEEMD